MIEMRYIRTWNTTTASSTTTASIPTYVGVDMGREPSYGYRNDSLDIWESPKFKDPDIPDWKKMLEDGD